ncbi:hypothetical protein TIFTF001_013289 [Ficus carica]|uniref:Uncharacterized protein n=1 Tax=Ficus carica TaxID=3494 RepID=A0AA88AHK8_FICCA|nr:hypothetical protein TIFTF001_013289 [Ficus carica]
MAVQFVLALWTRFWASTLLQFTGFQRGVSILFLGIPLPSGCCGVWFTWKGSAPRCRFLL